MDGEIVLAEAKFNPKVCTYWLLSGAVVLAVTIVFLPLVLVWFIVGGFFTRRYLERMSCTLTDRSLKVSRGFFVRIEKTIPLDKITDLGVTQGPIMRHFELEALSVETAGQSSVGALVRLTGIVDGRDFRDQVLRQRDLVTARPEGAPNASVAPDTSATNDLLREIRDSLQRLEQKLGDR